MNGLNSRNIRPSSTLNHVQSQPTQRRLLIPRLHIHPGLIHGRNHLIQRNFMLAPLAFRSMQGICTSPPIGSQVIPRLCSIPISAAHSTCSFEPPCAATNPPAAIEHATPTSPWHPTSAPLIEAFSLYKTPITLAV